MNAKWDMGENPIYKSAVKTVLNPVYEGRWVLPKWISQHWMQSSNFHSHGKVALGHFCCGFSVCNFEDV